MFEDACKRPLRLFGVPREEAGPDCSSFLAAATYLVATGSSAFGSALAACLPALGAGLTSGITPATSTRSVSSYKRPPVKAVEQDCAELANQRIARVGASALIVEGIHGNGIELSQEVGLVNLGFADARPGFRGLS